MSTRGYFYRNVPELGDVAVSRHAQERLEEANFSLEAFEKVLMTPIRPDIPDGPNVLWRERDGLRLVIVLKPTPYRGKALVTTVYRVDAAIEARRN